MTTARVPVASQADVEEARAAVRRQAHELGLPPVTAERVTLATMELATNLLRYARDGVIVIQSIEGPLGSGIQVESCDTGPGIADVALAMTDGYSTGGGLGHGLPAVRRLMDTFELSSGAGGTRIVACTWRT